MNKERASFFTLPPLLQLALLSCGIAVCASYFMLSYPEVLSIDRLSKVVYEGGFSIPYPLHFLSALAFERPAEILLTQYGFDVNGRTLQGNTPLHFAAAGCNSWMVEILVQHGADIFAQDRNGKTAFEIVRPLMLNTYQYCARRIAAVLLGSGFCSSDLINNCQPEDVRGMYELESEKSDMYNRIPTEERLLLYQNVYARAVHENSSHAWEYLDLIAVAHFKLGNVEQGHFWLNQSYQLSPVYKASLEIPMKLAEAASSGGIKVQMPGSTDQE